MFPDNERGWIVLFTDTGNAVIDYHHMRLGLSSAEHPDAAYRTPDLAFEKLIPEYFGSVTDVYEFGYILALIGRTLLPQGMLNLECKSFG